MPFDQALWDTNACGCRCLIELRKKKDGIVVSDADFYAKYASQYRGWANMPGATNTAMQVFLACDFNGVTDVDTFVDPARVIKECARPEYYGALLGTERLPDANDPGKLCETKHVMLLTNINHNGFAAWNPLQNGKAVEEKFPWYFWNQWMMRAMILYRV